MITSRDLDHFTPTDATFAGPLDLLFGLLFFFPATRVAVDAVLIILAGLADVHRDIAGETESKIACCAGEDPIFVTVVEEVSRLACCEWTGEIGVVLFEVGCCGFDGESVHC